ncbi:MAG: hypothetical protein HRF49_10820 [bacterium]
MAELKSGNGELRAAVVEAYREYPRACAIAARFGLHHSTVKRWAEAAGLCGSKPAFVVGAETGDCGMVGGFAASEIPECDRDGARKLTSRRSEALSAAESGEDARTIDELSVIARCKLLKAAFSKELIEKTAMKDITASYKIIEDVAMKKASLARALNQYEKSGEDGESDGLLAWEKAMLRILADTHPADEYYKDWMGQGD